MKAAFRTACLAALVLAAAGWAQAHTLGKRQYTCPACSTEFESVVANSGFQYGLRLDYKAVGAIYSPSPIQQCPSCRLAFIGDLLKRLPPQDPAALQAITASEEFASIPDGAPPFFYLAKIRELQGAPAEEAMFAYLQASWQAEGTEDLDDGRLKVGLIRNDAMIEQSLREALRIHSAFSSPPEGGPEAEYMHHALGVELNRRLGNFDEAESRLEAFRKALPAIRRPPGGERLPEIYQAYISQQAEAIAEKDTSPRLFAVPEPD